MEKIRNFVKEKSVAAAFIIVAIGFTLFLAVPLPDGYWIESTWRIIIAAALVSFFVFVMGWKPSDLGIRWKGLGKGLLLCWPIFIIMISIALLLLISISGIDQQANMGEYEQGVMASVGLASE